MSAAGVYLDWNATTPLHPEVIEAMRAAALDAWGNPSSVHRVGRRARAIIEELREAIAGLVASDPRDVVLTSGGTEANNLALSGVTALVTSRIEHPSVTRTAEALADSGIPVVWLPVPASGCIDPESVRAALSEVGAGATVAVMAVNHETGVIQPLGRILELVREAGARLHVDAVQALGKLAPEAFCQADSIAIAAHKIRGPKGVGALVFRGSPALLRPAQRGGSQERGLRAGTQDAVSAAGFLRAVQRAAQGPVRSARLAAERDRLEQAVARFATPNVGEPRLPHVTSLFVRGVRGDELVAALDLEGLHVSSGAACSAGSSEPSPVLSAMLGDGRARGSIRVSLGEDTRPEDVDEAISIMSRVLSARVPST
jgi:cysteine desulfurase